MDTYSYTYYRCYYRERNGTVTFSDHATIEEAIHEVRINRKFFEYKQWDDGFMYITAITEGQTMPSPSNS